MSQSCCGYEALLLPLRSGNGLLRASNGTWNVPWRHVPQPLTRLRALVVHRASRAPSARSASSTVCGFAKSALNVAERALTSRPGFDNSLLHRSTRICIIDVVELAVECLLFG